MVIFGILSLKGNCGWTPRFFLKNTKLSQRGQKSLTDCCTKSLFKKVLFCKLWGSFESSYLQKFFTHSNSMGFIRKPISLKVPYRISCHGFHLKAHISESSPWIHVMGFI